MLRPFDARVVVKKPKREEQTASGIILPDTVNEQGQTALGEVIAVGPGRMSEYGQMIPVRSCKIGDVVLVPKIGTLRIDFEGEEYYIAQDREILAVIKDSENE